MPRLFHALSYKIIFNNLMNFNYFEVWSDLWMRCQATMHYDYYKSSIFIIINILDLYYTGASVIILDKSM